MPKIYEIECDCCGGVAAREELFEDGQPLLCGCRGQISFCSETDPYCSIDSEEECPPTAGCGGEPYSA